MRPNNNFERLCDFSANLNRAWLQSKGEKKRRLGALLAEINGSYFQSVEETDQVPRGARDLDEIINED